MLGSHIVLCTYGFWLPNDPRGSWSHFVWSDELLRHGQATKVETRQSVARHAHDVQQRRAAKQSLRYPEVILTGKQALTVSRGFKLALQRFEAPVWACAILPQHAHLVVGVGTAHVEVVVAAMKQAATWELRKAGQHPLVEHTSKSGRTPSPWARGFWKVFINDVQHLETEIRYVQRNPLKEGKPPQQWSFVVPYDGRAPHT